MTDRISNKKSLVPWISFAVFVTAHNPTVAQTAQTPEERTATVEVEVPPVTVEAPTKSVESTEPTTERDTAPIVTTSKPAETTEPLSSEPIPTLERPTATVDSQSVTPPPATRLFKPGLLLQTWARVEDAPAVDDFDTRFTLFIRRIRILLSGQINDYINYFAETDNPNFGKYGDFSPNMFIQDAWVELNLAREFQLDIGMLLIPLSHHGMQGATTLNALDYHSRLIRYPAGKVWRDMGAMVRGLLFDDLLEYRLAVTNGVHPNTTPKTNASDETYPTDPRNPKEWPRFTARLTVNAFEPEGVPTVAGFFYKGIHLKETPQGIISSKKVLSLGGSIDWQRGANVSMREETQGVWEFDEIRDYFSAAADIYADIPLSQDKRFAVTGQIDFYYYNHGERDAPSFYGLDGNKNLYSGVGLATELGLRYDAIEPIINFDWFNSSKMPEGSESIGDYLAIYGGINYFWMAHAMSFKLEVGAQKEPREYEGEIIDEFAPFGTFQSQFIF